MSKEADEVCLSLGKFFHLLASYPHLTSPFSAASLCGITKKWVGGGYGVSPDQLWDYIGNRYISKYLSLGYSICPNCLDADEADKKENLEST